MKQCPCEASRDYSVCCGKHHNNNQSAETPESLMRSRYSAYVLGNIAYIKNTMIGVPLESFDEEEATKWTKSIRWLGLNVINSNQNDKNGMVEFIAKYLDGNLLRSIHEVSEFIHSNNQWYYTGGRLKPEPSVKILPNVPCPCGSKLKFKNCNHV